MKKILTSCLGLFAAFMLASCVEYESEITVNKDGSGTITEEMVFGAQAVQMMNMMAQQGGKGGNPLAEMKDEAKMKEKAKSYGEGVTYVKSETINRNGGSGVKVTYKFEDINKVSFKPGGEIDELGKKAPGAAPNAGNAAAVAVEQRAKFEYADGVLTVKMPKPEGGEDREENEEEAGKEFDPNDPQMAMAAQMLKGMKVSVKLTAKPGIAETNAAHQEGDSITLMEMKFDELIKNPQGMKALDQMKGQNRKGMAEMLKSIKGAKMETQEKVTVKLK